MPSRILTTAEENFCWLHMPTVASIRPTRWRLNYSHESISSHLDHSACSQWCDLSLLGSVPVETAALLYLFMPIIACRLFPPDDRPLEYHSGGFSIGYK